MTGWRAMLRIAWRDARRARGRSALIVAMIALPVLGMTAADVLLRSGQLDPDERVAVTIGAAQARLERVGAGPILQAPDPEDGTTSTADSGGSAADPPPLARLAPAGYRVLGERSGFVQTRTRSGVGTVGWSEVAAGDPALRGRFVVRQGRAARRPGEVAVTPELLARLGVAVGARVELTELRRTVRVTGVIEERLSPSRESFFAPAGALGASAGLGPERLYLVGARPIEWRDVLALNRRGVGVYSRAVILHPPPRSAVPLFSRDGASSIDPVPYIAVALVIALAALEVTLLAGAAFAVGARRQARTLALVAVSGGNERQLRRVVLGGGVVLGALGAAVGVVAGLALAALALPGLARRADAPVGHFDVRLLEIGAIALIGVLTGVLAAVVPARLAARQDPVHVLSGRRGTVGTPRRVPLLGVLVVCAGVAASLIGSAVALADATGASPGTGLSARSLAALIAGGAVLTQLGLIACSPAIIGLCGRLAGRLPLATRLALRDAARHRGRSAPAMAAVLTAVAAGTALALYITAVDDHDRRLYQPRWPKGVAGVTLWTLQDGGAGRAPREVRLDPAEVLSRVAPKLPPATATVVDAETSLRCPDGCPRAYPVAPAGGIRFENEGLNPNWGGVPVGGKETLRVTTGTSSPAAEAVLEAGGVVVTDPRFLAGGHVELEVVSVAAQRRASAGGTVPHGRRVQVPGVYLKAPDGATAVYSRAAAKRVGLDVAPSTLALHFTGRLPTTDEEDAARAALADAGVNAAFSVERGYVGNYGVGLLALALGAALITLGAAGISTGLAQADARDDHATLAAIGAAPRLRKTLAAAQSLTIAALGTVLGVLAGFVPAVALIAGAPSLELVVPWGLLAGAIVGTPLLAATAAWLLTRARLPLRSRVA